VHRGGVGFVRYVKLCYTMGTPTKLLVHTRRNKMKSFKPTRKLVDQILDGNPLGNIFLINALQSYADQVIKYATYLDKHNIDSLEYVDPHALSRTAEEVVEYMDKHFK